MAGGGGTRFWPLSRKNKPKQILNISGNDVMINETIKRYEGIIPYENTYVVTLASQQKVLDEVLLTCIPRENILIEPVGRNTAPCILYAAMRIFGKYGDAVMCVFPSDHYVANVEEFRNILNKAIVLAQETNKLITIGIKPTFPSTGYGYINFDLQSNNNGAYDVLEFIEKPDFERAKEYLKSKNYLWNSGIFVWKISVILESFKRFLPRLYERAEEILSVAGTDQEQKTVEKVYPRLQSISIDYGIMERSNEVLVIPGDFGWSDIGSWDMLGAIFPPDDEGNIIKADFVGIDTKNCIIYGNGKLIATIGLDNIIIVNTEDALLICPKERAQDVKEIVERIKRQGRMELL
jgi:mannose-1-phosphate guanylyltransferase